MCDIGQIEVGVAFWEEYQGLRTAVRVMYNQMVQKWGGKQ